MKGLRLRASKPFRLHQDRKVVMQFHFPLYLHNINIFIRFKLKIVFDGSKSFKFTKVDRPYDFNTPETIEDTSPERSWRNNVKASGSITYPIIKHHIEKHKK